MQRPMSVVLLARSDSELLVIAFEKARQERIGRFDRAYAVEPKLFDQAVLQRAIYAFDAALGLR